MKLYSVFDNDQWVADMTADDIAEMIGCTREQVIRAVANASVINDRYTFGIRWRHHCKNRKYAE